jgi:hypothetical protein
MRKKGRSCWSFQAILIHRNCHTDHQPKDSIVSFVMRELIQWVTLERRKLYGGASGRGVKSWM